MTRYFVLISCDALIEHCSSRLHVYPKIQQEIHTMDATIYGLQKNKFELQHKMHKELFPLIVNCL